jgi:hypothetical protein
MSSPQQAEAEAADSVEVLASTPQTSSFSIPRSLGSYHLAAAPSTAAAAADGGERSHHQRDAAGEGRDVQPEQPPQQQQQQQHGTGASGLAMQQQRPQQSAAAGTSAPAAASGGSSSSARPGAGLAPLLQPYDTSAAELFLQRLQQELNKVRDFVQDTAASLAVSLQALAASAPALAAQDAAALEQQANALGQQLLALEGFVHLNEAGFVKIVRKHDRVRRVGRQVSRV